MLEITGLENLQHRKEKKESDLLDWWLSIKTKPGYMLYTPCIFTPNSFDDIFLLSSHQLLEQSI